MTVRGLLDLSLWALTVTCLSTLAVVSLGPLPSLLASFPQADELLHVTAYFLASFMLLLCAVWHPLQPHGRLAGHTTKLLFVMIVVGVGLELGQFAGNHRTPDALDALMNTAGILGAFVSWSTLRSGVNLVGGRK